MPYGNNSSSSGWANIIAHPDGYLYFMPAYLIGTSKTQNSCVKFDPVTETVVTEFPVLNGNTIIRSILAPNGCIYCLLRGSSITNPILKIDPVGQTYTYIGSYTASNQGTIILAPNGKIIFTMATFMGGGSSCPIYMLDPSDDSIIELQNKSIYNTYAFINSSGNVIIPNYYNCLSIDPDTGTVTEIDKILTTTSSKACYFNNRIYVISTNLSIFDVDTLELISQTPFDSGYNYGRPFVGVDLNVYVLSYYYTASSTQYFILNKIDSQGYIKKYKYELTEKSAIRSPMLGANGIIYFCPTEYYADDPSIAAIGKEGVVYPIPSIMQMPALSQLAASEYNRIWNMPNMY
jgi:hypothetical protein